MTAEEFLKWADYHFARFPEDQKKLEELTGKNFASTLEGWEAVLSTRKYGACIAATNSMLAGEIKRPFHASDIPATINQAAAEIEAREATSKLKPSANYDPRREPKYKCAKCQDTGIAPILHPGMLKFARQGILYRALWHYRDAIKREGRVLNAICDCEAGLRKKSKHYNEDGRYCGPICVQHDSLCVSTWWYPAMKNREFAAECEKRIDEFFEPVTTGDFADFATPERQLEF